ncbi:MAG TPA: nitroreductase family protein [Candidatus Paceibacterota bacterium]|nr:nitroreductase family protein [Verrucomicrobiota bacterium]HRZ47024.1 nitroreductase family protein [Candidatus Paceibacterota bacterium]HRZ92755.1 nitroreductase family protein [Candidatus Paceibacterota bacterium]
MKSQVTPEQAMQLIQSRRSIRVYEPGLVSPGIVQQLLEAAMAAPSAVAKDPWRFVVVQSATMLEKLAPVLSNGSMLLQAGMGIVVCGDLEAAHDRQLSFLLQDCAAAIQNLLLCAHAHGLGACWLGIHPREPRVSAVREILSLPASVIPVGCVAVGHPAEVKPARTRYNEAFVHWDKW